MGLRGAFTGPSLSRWVLNQPGTADRRWFWGPFQRGVPCRSEQDARRGGQPLPGSAGLRDPNSPSGGPGVPCRLPRHQRHCLVLGEGARRRECGLWRKRPLETHTSPQPTPDGPPNPSLPSRLEFRAAPSPAWDPLVPGRARPSLPVSLCLLPLCSAPSIPCPAPLPPGRACFPAAPRPHHTGWKRVVRSGPGSEELRLPDGGLSLGKAVDTGWALCVHAPPHRPRGQAGTSVGARPSQRRLAGCVPDGKRRPTGSPGWVCGAQGQVTSSSHRNALRGSHVDDDTDSDGDGDHIGLSPHTPAPGSSGPSVLRVRGPHTVSAAGGRGRAGMRTSDQEHGWWPGPGRDGLWGPGSLQSNRALLTRHPPGSGVLRLKAAGTPPPSATGVPARGFVSRLHRSSGARPHGHAAMLAVPGLQARLPRWQQQAIITVLAGIAPRIACQPRARRVSLLREGDPSIAAVGFRSGRGIAGT